MLQNQKILKALSKRACILRWPCVLGLCIPLLDPRLAQAGTLMWILDLASHWQWVFATGLLILTLFIAFTSPKNRALWLLGLLALPFYTASPSLPESTELETAPEQTLRIASANVHFENTDPTKLLAWAQKEMPDVVVLLELSEEYAKNLREKTTYPHQYFLPGQSPFGIGLLSKIPLIKPQRHTDSNEIPYLETQLELDGQRLTLITFHPMPPISAEDHEVRNKTLYQFAQRAKEAPLIIAGDLNASAWSGALHQLTSFGLKRTTSLLPTWPTALKGLSGIPIDHILASTHFVSIDSDRAESIGSDHYPVLSTLLLQ